MTKLRLFVTLIILALAATFTFAHDGEVQHRFKLKLDGDSEAIVIDDLEVGETRQLYTDSGKEVIVTREEDGLQLTVDGKEINIHRPQGHHGASIVNVDGDDDGEVKVVVKKKVVHGDGEEDGDVMVWHGDGDHEHDVVMWGGDEEGGEHGFAFISKPDMAEHLLESGVLDDLDPEKREEILRVIREADRHVIHHRTKVVDDEDV